MKPYSNLSNLIHREGYIFVVIFGVISLILSSFSSTIGLVGLISTLYCCYFFRNPARVTPVADDLIISAADGIVQQVIKTSPPSELAVEEDMVRVSIFLNIFNVHVNRIPASGKILSLHYFAGKFFNASLDKASIHNERQSILMETNSGKRIGFVQIAGLIARRIVCDLEEKQEVSAGERFGIIRFGSRVDIYLPLDSEILVTEGQTCIGGETVIADIGNKQNHSIKFEKN